MCIFLNGAETGLGKKSEVANLEGWLSSPNTITVDDDGEEFTAVFKVDKNFGMPGAILIENHHPNWFFLRYITLHTPSSVLYFQCNSWVYNYRHYDSPRVFFTNQVLAALFTLIDPHSTQTNIDMCAGCVFSQ